MAQLGEALGRSVGAGEGHWNVLGTLRLLAELFVEQKKYDQALKVLLRISRCVLVGRLFAVHRVPHLLMSCAASP